MSCMMLLIAPPQNAPPQSLRSIDLDDHALNRHALAVNLDRSARPLDDQLHAGVDDNRLLAVLADVSGVNVALVGHFHRLIVGDRDLLIVDDRHLLIFSDKQSVGLVHSCRTIYIKLELILFMAVANSEREFLLNVFQALPCRDHGRLIAAANIGLESARFWGRQKIFARDLFSPLRRAAINKNTAVSFLGNRGPGLGYRIFAKYFTRHFYAPPGLDSKTY